jgi:hypothetical protein
MLTIDKEMLRNEYKRKTGNKIYDCYSGAATLSIEVENYKRYSEYIEWLENELEEVYGKIKLLEEDYNKIKINDFLITFKDKIENSQIINIFYKICDAIKCTNINAVVRKPDGTIWEYNNHIGEK